MRRPMDGSVIADGHDLRQGGDAVAQAHHLGNGEISDNAGDEVGFAQRLGEDGGDRLLERSRRKSPARRIRNATLPHQPMRHIVPMPDALLVRMARRQPIAGLVEQLSGEG